MRHIIKTEILDFQIDDRLDAFRMQQEMSEYNRKVILSALEKVLDELSPTDRVIRLDRLELDLGILRLKEVKQGAMTGGIYETIKDQVKDLLRETYSPGTFVRTGALGSAVAQWLFYMKEGYLDWNTISIDEDWYRQVLGNFATDAGGVEQFRQLMASDGRALQRVVSQHSEDFITRLIALLTTNEQTELIPLLKELEKITGWILLVNKKMQVDSREIGRRLWEQVLHIAASPIERLTTAEIGYRIMKMILPDTGTLGFLQKELEDELDITAPLIRKLLHDHYRSPERQEKRSQVDEQDTSEGRDEPMEDSKIHPEKKTGDAVANPDLLNVSAKKEMMPDDRNKWKELFGSLETQPALKSDMATGKEGLFVANAGIVLLRPFLLAFFRNLALVEGNDFANRYQQLRAVYLLHFLATGETAPDEYKLVMPKILCGFPIAAPAVAPGEFTAVELEECDHLLEAAIAQWPILGNTSPNVLRAEFLQRNGKLDTRNENVYLQVESSSIDLLLDHLPWNLGMVKLPWMKDVLRVEWR